MIRFAKTGSDAGTAAVRAARAITKRNNIAYWGSGGVWHDWVTVITSRNEGIPKILRKMIKKFEYNDLESLKIVFEAWHGEVAAVYMEPMITNFPKNNFLNDVKKIAKKNGALLIFDEVQTGFRYSLGGAQELLKIQADLAVFGKGVANGMPLAVITGKTKYMEKFNDVFYSTTYGGETLSLAASIAVINEMETKPVIKHCWDLGSILNNEFNTLAYELKVNIKMELIPVRSSILFTDGNGKPSLLLKSLFYQEMVKRGVLFGPGWVFLSYSHSMNDIKKTLEAAKTSMKIVKNAIKTKTVNKSLRGKTMKSVMTF